MKPVFTLRSCLVPTRSLAVTLLGFMTAAAVATPNIRNTFFDLYPDALGTPLSTLTSVSRDPHCGVCHEDFQGGGPPWNVYGDLVRSNMDVNELSAELAILAVESVDADHDGFVSGIEITNTAYDNTPTFPGWSPLNVGLADNVDLNEIQGYLVPSSGADVTPPEISNVSPNGGEVITANVSTNILWTATDAGSGVAGISIYLSLDNGATYEPVALGLANSGTYTWFPPNRPSGTAVLRIVAVDNAFNSATNESAAVFNITSPVGGVVPTTLRDFDMPGTQPHELAAGISPPSDCLTCHGNYNTDHEPYFNWGGSMMAHASIDPLFLANLAIANQDAPDSGDLCLRCHIHAGWVQGRSVPTSGEAMLPGDKHGVSCGLCHRMIDPIYEPGVSPPEDATILANMMNPGTNFGIGMIHLDPTDQRRGPFNDATNAPHTVLVSTFHREAAFCGTCHDVSNPAFDRDPDGSYSPNTVDTPATDFSSEVVAPVERTYSEWLFSDFNTPTGVHLPQFAGNKADGFVATCQDCHMRDIAGYGCDTNLYPLVPERQDLPLHDLTGGSTWLPMILADLYPDQVDSNAVAAGVARATALLQNAADLTVHDGPGPMLTNIVVRITNNCGHKLPTGYPEGRRIWINVKFFDASTNLLGESAAYNLTNGILAHDAEAKIYEIHPGIDSDLVSILESLGQTNFSEGPSYHFVLNNAVFGDNRIPPRGFVNANFDTFGGAPVGHTYADGQYWDDTVYGLPPGTKWAEVRLYYQSTSKEFVEFLRDENTTNTKGDEMYDIWSTNGMCPPTLMQQGTWMNPFLLADTRYTNNVFHVEFHCRTNTSYTVQYTDNLTPPVVWSDFQNNGTHVPLSDRSFFEDDFTSNTSGAPSSTGMRFYRFQYTDL